MPTARSGPLHDENWRVAPARLLHRPFTRRDFDARLVERGWNKINFMIQNGCPQWGQRTGRRTGGLSCAAPRSVNLKSQAGFVAHAHEWDMIFDLGQNAAHIQKFPSPARRQQSAHHSIGTHEQGRLGKPGFDGRKSYGDLVRVHESDGRRGNVGAEIFYVGCRYLQIKFLPATAKPICLPSNQLAASSFIVMRPGRPISMFQ